MKAFLRVAAASALLCSFVVSAQLLSDRNDPAPPSSATTNTAPQIATYIPPAPMQWPKATLGEPVEKQFTVVQHFEYLQRVYGKSAVMEPLSERNAGAEIDPESVLRSLLSAKLQNDQSWWLNLWDKAAREKLSAADNELHADYWPAHWPADQSAQTAESDIAAEDENAGKPPLIQLRRWVLTGQVVMISYRLGKGDEASLELPVVFALSEGKWLATLDYLDDPVMQKLMPAATAIASREEAR